MSAPEEYVVRWSAGVYSRGFRTEAEAREYGEGSSHTVHKVGPAIEAPEPREWVIFWSDDDTFEGPLTASEARMHIGRGGRRLARLVFEDPA